MAELADRNQGEEGRSRHKRLAGVRGWLLVFVLILAFNTLTSIAVVPFFVTQILSSTPGMLLVVATITLTVLGVATFGFLVTRARHAPRWAAAWLIFYTVFRIVLLATGTRSKPAVLGLLLFGSAWLVYFAVSKRVKATYGEAPADEEIELSFPPDPAQEGNPYAPPGSRRLD